MVPGGDLGHRWYHRSDLVWFWHPKQRPGSVSLEKEDNLRVDGV